jgi:endoglucanase
MKNSKKINSLPLLISISLICPFGYAAKLPITNAILGLGPDSNKVTPYLCIQDKNQQVKPGCALASGESVADAGTCSGNPYYAGASLRFGGCQDTDTYLGYMGIDSKGISYQPPDAVYIGLNNAAINSSGVITGTVDYKPINANFNFLATAPTNSSVWLFTGVNLSGLEFGKFPAPSVVPNLAAEDVKTPFSDVPDTKAFLSSGMNTVRVPMHWGYLQPNGTSTPIDQHYFNSYVKPLLETLTHAKVHTILDLHSYMRYSEFGKQYAGCGSDGPCPDGHLITDPKIYQDIWDQLYQLINKDPSIDQQYLMLDLVNEPVNVPGDGVFTIQAAVIKSLRSQGFNGYILIEGNNWSGLHSWTSSWTDNQGQSYSNERLFRRDNFVKNGITDLTKILINVHQYLDSDFSGTHDSCQADITTTGKDGFNLDDFVSFLQKNELNAIVTEFGVGKDASTCSPILNQFMNYLKMHAATKYKYGFVGWTIWSTGHGWGSYNLRVLPNSYAMDVIKPYLLP